MVDYCEKWFTMDCEHIKKLEQEKNRLASTLEAANKLNHDLYADTVILDRRINRANSIIESYACEIPKHVWNDLRTALNTDEKADSLRSAAKEIFITQHERDETATNILDEEEIYKILCKWSKSSFLRSKMEENKP